MRINFLKSMFFVGGLSLSLVGCATTYTQKVILKDDFVHLRSIDPSIKQYIRYNTTDNFLSERVDGYKANECILKKDAALALKSVQVEAKKLGFSIIAFDCYRPQKAVDHFVRWVAQSDKTKPNYFDNIPQNQLIERGYIASRSNHSKGYTIDLALVSLKNNKKENHKYYGCAGRMENYTLDFGTPFDCFDTASNTFNPIVTGEAAKNRKILVDLMAAQGFSNYSEEWWHFTHSSQPKDAPAYNFDVE